jgi:HPt (histidine-containing phosphotransfer) domain-containing protein
MTSTKQNQFSEQVFDMTEALENVGEDMDLLKEIVEIFLKDFPNQIEQIQEGILAGDSNAVEQAAHSLKGSVANFAAKRTHEAAYRLEVLGREGNLEEAKEALADLEREIGELEAALKAVLKGP